MEGEEGEGMVTGKDWGGEREKVRNWDGVVG